MHAKLSTSCTWARSLLWLDDTGLEGFIESTEGYDISIHSRSVTIDFKSFYPGLNRRNRKIFEGAISGSIKCTQSVWKGRGRLTSWWTSECKLAHFEYEGAITNVDRSIYEKN